MIKEINDIEDNDADDDAWDDETDETNKRWI